MEDTTGRRRVEEALRESEKRYKLLLGSVTDYIYTVQVQDGRSVATVHGPGCAAVTGYAPEDYAADPDLWYRMVYEPDRPAVMQQAVAILAGGASSPLEHRIVHRDGSVRWVRNTSVPHYDQQGHLAAYDGLVSDITSRKQAEQELQGSEARFRTLTEDAPIAISMSRLGRVVYANPSYLRMFGFERAEELDNRPTIELFAPQCRDEVMERANRRAQGLPVPREYETIGRRAGGSEFPMLVAVITMQFSEGSALVGFITDLTGPQAGGGRAQAAGRAAPAGTEAGEYWQVGWRSGSRLQQPPDGQQRIQSIAAARLAGRRSAARQPRGDPQRWGTRGGADSPAGGL